MSLPTPEEISPTSGLDLDEKSALEHFYGKTQREAARLFFEKPLYYEGDLKWMGTKGFSFYFPALEPYILSKESAGDSDFVNAIVGTVKTQLEYDPIAIYECKSSVLRILIFCLNNLTKFDADTAIYGDLGMELRKLIDIIESGGRIEHASNPLAMSFARIVRVVRKAMGRLQGKTR